MLLWLDGVRRSGRHRSFWGGSYAKMRKCENKPIKCSKSARFSKGPPKRSGMHRRWCREQSRVRGYGMAGKRQTKPLEADRTSRSAKTNPINRKNIDLFLTNPDGLRPRPICRTIDMMSVKALGRSLDRMRYRSARLLSGAFSVLPDQSLDRSTATQQASSRG